MAEVVEVEEEKGEEEEKKEEPEVEVDEEGEEEDICAARKDFGIGGNSALQIRRTEIRPRPTCRPTRRGTRGSHRPSSAPAASALHGRSGVTSPAAQRQAAKHGSRAQRQCYHLPMRSVLSARMGHGSTQQSAPLVAHTPTPHHSTVTICLDVFILFLRRL